MKKLIIIKQGDQVITNRDITEPAHRPVIVAELKEQYPESAYSYFLHDCNEGQPCKEVPVKFKELEKMAKSAAKDEAADDTADDTTDDAAAAAAAAGAGKKEKGKAAGKK